MAVIDAQVHVYEPDHPGRPWIQKLHGEPHNTGAEQVAYMDAVGVDGAIIVSTYTSYRFDASYAEEVHASYPDRFRLVKPVDTTDPAVREVIADWAARPGAAGVRVMLSFAETRNPLDPGLNLAVAAAAAHDLPMNILVWNELDAARTLIERHPDTLFLIDHLGILQPFRPDHPNVWEDLPKVLALAELDNVCVKVTGAGTLSTRPFPYEDIWDPVLRIVDAYGVDRCLWGTDWTRATKWLSYQQGVDAFQMTSHFSDSDRAMLMGGTAEKIYGWTPRAG
jgi:predicted TIM-barrel fold metal-dependent hydrolase